MQLVEHSTWQLKIDGKPAIPVAEGYRVSDSAIREHKRTKPDELIEGKHFISVSNPGAIGNQATVYWKKRGVIRLGFFVRSKQIKAFRLAEDISLGHKVEVTRLSPLSSRCNKKLKFPH
ncbi:hypothetical protein HNQ92_003179 [Rhabdobacter roseus]|uniref:Uncharacterized protein n=1 Tax=Rhabdobacter roseus TaxID=1655419 RepID=A0A840TN00_9BACT|nr:hypothetical protein [Rhabdobacter roseus]MBB5285031.1 hypothetical protein [Rhabdobacter roseus]